MSIQKISSIVIASVTIFLSPAAMALDNAFIQEWARQRAVGQPRLMPEIQKPQTGTQEAVNVATNAANQANSNVVYTKGVTVCRSNFGLGDNRTFYCDAFGNEKFTLKKLYAMGWHITNIITWNNDLLFIAEER